jgi:5-methylthioadenosine/S-adenosylhomocysteine deaminase
MPGHRTPPTGVDLLIQNGVFITMDSARTILYDGALAVADGRIVALGPAEQLAGRFVAKKTINARHKAVLPGLIDTHHHFLQNLLKGSRDDLAFVDWIDHVSSPRIVLAVQDYLAGESALQVYATRLGCIEALKSGITCILNMEWATPPDVIQVYEETGIRAVHVLTLTDVDQWQKSGMLLSQLAGLDLADQLVGRCKESQGSRVTFRYGPACENSASPELLRQVRALADLNGVGIHIHMAESKFGWDNIHHLYGKTPIGYLHSIGLLGRDVLGAHAIWLSDEDIQILSETGTSVSYNPECHMKIALGIAPVVKMLQAGVTLSLGTDTCAVNDNMDLFEAMRVGAMLQKLAAMDPAVVPAYQALEMATIGGAKALGMEDEIGSLEAGKRADIILVDLTGVHMRPINHIVNNLVYCATAASDVATVIVDGQLVVEDGKLLCCDEQEAIAEVEEFALRRFARAGLELSPYYQVRG